jgi:hypothetical protein
LRSRSGTACQLNCVTTRNITVSSALLCTCPEMRDCH